MPNLSSANFCDHKPETSGVNDELPKLTEEFVPAPSHGAAASLGKQAIVAITISLVAVFIPLAFQKTTAGRLFIEFAVAISFSVIIH